MSVLGPIPLALFAWLAGGAAVLAISAYIIKMRRRRFEVPFSRLWQRVLEQRDANALWKQLRRLLSLLLILFIAYSWLSGRSIQGWTSLMLVVVVLGAVQMFVLALMGEYIGRLYNEAKGRPLYVVQEVAGGRGSRDEKLGYIADATANSDNPGGNGKRPTR